MRQGEPAETSAGDATPLTTFQVAAIADKVAPWYRGMVLLGAVTGMRDGELRGLTTDRVRDGTVWVDRQLAGGRNGLPVFSPTKNDSVRSVPLGQVAAAELERHLQEWPTVVDGLVFTGRQHEPITRTIAGDQWRKAITGMGLQQRAGWHELRHHHASLLIAAGLSSRAV